MKISKPQKAYYWNCKCGCINIAPAIQTPDNTVACEKCKNEFRWADVSVPKPPK